MFKTILNRSFIVVWRLMLSILNIYWTENGNDVDLLFGFPRRSTYHGGYTYGTYSGNNASKIYLRCSGYRSTGCRGKGYMLRGQGPESFVLIDEHSHPPNFLMERRSEIAATLKEFAATIPGKSIDVYNSVVSIYPEVKQIWPFSRAVRTINRIRQRTGFMRNAH